MGQDPETKTSRHLLPPAPRWQSGAGRGAQCQLLMLEDRQDAFGVCGRGSPWDSLGAFTVLWRDLSPVGTVVSVHSSEWRGLGVWLVDSARAGYSGPAVPALLWTEKSLFILAAKICCC